MIRWKAISLRRTNVMMSCPYVTSVSESMQITPGGNGIGETGGSVPYSGLDRKIESSSGLVNVETGFRVCLVFFGGC